MQQTPSKTLQIFAANLRRIRKEKNLSQEALADAAGLDKAHIGYLEQMRNSPSLDTVGRIAEALGVPVGDFFNDMDSELPEDADLGRLNSLLPSVRRYQKLAEEYNINDIFQDNGGKLLQTLILTGLQNLPGREGNDAIDNDGNEWELKTVNANLVKQFSTHHHLTEAIIDKYRKVKWLFCVYEGIEIVEIWVVDPKDLEPIFEKWVDKLRSPGVSHLNNPKIPLETVRRVGKLFYRDKVDDKVNSAKKLATFAKEPPLKKKEW